MNSYQGRALDLGPRTRGPRSPRPFRQPLRIAGLMAALLALAMMPWGELRRRFAVVDRVKVTGLRYLDAERVRKRSGLAVGQDLFTLDVERARQRVLMDPRIREAQVRHSGLRGVELAIVERAPALTVAHGEPWEVDSSGVLLAPLQPGVVADVPMLAGPDFSAYGPGTQIRTPQVQRGLAWTAALSDNALRLAGQVSEVDVSDPRITRLVLMNGVQVVGPAWPPGMRQLSGLRATLADLEHKGMKPREIDARFPDQIIVRGVEPPATQVAAEATHRS